MLREVGPSATPTLPPDQQLPDPLIFSRASARSGTTASWDKSPLRWRAHFGPCGVGTIGKRPFLSASCWSPWNKHRCTLGAWSWSSLSLQADQLATMFDRQSVSYFSAVPTRSGSELGDRYVRVPVKHGYHRIEKISVGGCNPLPPPTTSTRPSERPSAPKDGALQAPAAKAKAPKK